jgi:hypothetical protein
MKETVEHSAIEGDLGLSHKNWKPFLEKGKPVANRISTFCVKTFPHADDSIHFSLEYVMMT